MATTAVSKPEKVNEAMLYTTEQLARSANVSRSRVWKLAREGTLKGMRLADGRSYVFGEDSVRWLKENTASKEARVAAQLAKARAVKAAKNGHGTRHVEGVPEPAKPARIIPYQTGYEPVLLAALRGIEAHLGEIARAVTALATTKR